MSTWLNDDGLYIKGGVDEAAMTIGGENTTDGNTRVVDFDIGFADLAVFGTEKILSDVLVIPDGVFLESATFLVTTAFAGATGTLTLGIINKDRSSVIDPDGIDATIAITAIDAIGDTIACDGALVGTTIATGGLVTALVGTANLTAGAGKLTLKYFTP